MAKILAGLTLLLFALPAIILSLWWAALWSRFLQRVPAGDPWETQVSPRRAARLLVLLVMVGGCAAIVWGWAQFADGQLDVLGLRPIADWAFLTLRSP
jgi:hypothetical protein